jgi:hypothetical protein
VERTAVDSKRKGICVCTGDSFGRVAPSMTEPCYPPDERKGGSLAARNFFYTHTQQYGLGSLKYGQPEPHLGNPATEMRCGCLQ